VVEELGDLPVTVYDRRGYGRSLTPGATGVGFDVHADDLVAILDGTPSVVVGHSAGAAVAMFTAGRAPELILALGLWEPPMTAWDWSPRNLRELSLAMGRSKDPGATVESFMRMVLGDAQWEQLPEPTRDHLRAEGAAFRADMVSQDRQFIAIDELRVPGIVGCGDEIAEHVDAHTRTAKEIGFDLLVIKGTGHFAHVTHPGAWARFVRATVDLARQAGRHTAQAITADL
jgi:pimeloyl-ACP methyl ester carboxylesterase